MEKAIAYLDLKKTRTADVGHEFAADVVCHLVVSIAQVEDLLSSLELGEIEPRQIIVRHGALEVRGWAEVVMRDAPRRKLVRRWFWSAK